MVTEDEFKLIEKRMEAWPENYRVIFLSNLGSFTKDEILDHLRKRDVIGQKIAEIQLYYLKKLKERR